MNPIREAMKNLPGHWHQGDFSNGSNGDLADVDATAYCGLGHVYRALGSNNAFLFPGLRFMHKVAGELYPDRTEGGTRGFPVFNDHPDTTEEDVLAVMEKAAIRFEEQI